MAKSGREGQAERQEALLAAAAGVFAQRGYHAATVAEIAKGAHVATGTFYLYFPSKEQCFGQLVARFYETVLREVRRERRGAASVLVKLDRSIDAVLQCFRHERDLATHDDRQESRRADHAGSGERPGVRRRGRGDRNDGTARPAGHVVK